MGQTQLLMIVLAVMIVGIAVTVGITQFGESALAANRDAINTDCATVVSKAQGWFRKPTSLGGGGNSFANFSLAKAGVAASNDNGSISVTTADATTFTVRCTGNEEITPGTAVYVDMSYTTTGDTIAYTSNL